MFNLQRPVVGFALDRVVIVLRQRLLDGLDGLLDVADHGGTRADGRLRGARGLREEGFSVELASSGRAGLSRAAQRDMDALVLDLGLPDIDGIEVLAVLRAAGQQMPILVLTARDAVDSRVHALEAGADDYLVKPFAFAELLARLKALLRRASAPRWAPLSCGDLRLEPVSSSAYVAERSVPLSPRERSLLELLLRRQGETVTRPDIHREVFGYEFDPGTNVVDVHVAHLRRKFVSQGPNGGARFTLQLREAEPS